MPKLIRITTVPMALKFLLPGQMHYMSVNGYEVIMVSSDGPEREDVIKNENCRHIIVPMSRSITPLADLRSLVALYRLFRTEKPDIVHSHTPKAGLLAMIAAKMANIKIRIHTVAGLRFMTATGLTRRLLVQMEKWTASAATSVWPNSKSLMEYMRSENLCPPSKLHLIKSGSSNGINLARFSKDSLTNERIDEAKKLVGFDSSLTYLLTVGRIVKDKGIAELVTAFDNVYRENNGLRLILVGELEQELDPLDPDTLRVVQSHPGIIRTGWRNDVECFMVFARLLIHASHREGFPNVLLQAGALGCPVLCSQIAGNVDIVDNEESGIIFAAANPADLEAKLRKALAEPSTMARYATALGEKVRNNFRREVVHKAILDQYNQLLERR